MRIPEFAHSHPRRAALIPLDATESLFFPESDAGLRELDAIVDGYAQHPDFTEVIVLCEFDRYLDAIGWLRARKATECVLRVVRLAPEIPPHGYEVCTFLCDDVGLAKGPAGFWTASFASDPDGSPG